MLEINHLIFMDDVKLFAWGSESLIHTVRVVSTDTGMQFGISKCAKLVMWRGKSDEDRWKTNAG